MATLTRETADYSLTLLLFYCIRRIRLGFAHI